MLTLAGRGTFRVDLPPLVLFGRTLVTQIVTVDAGLTRLQATNLGASLVRS